MRYHPEIDGLRAVAVVPVILFHAGFPAFSGGFVGVDVFFVISGFLITTIIVADLEAGRFSFARFYERRARRILPALFLVVVACIPFAWFWMLPGQLERFAQSVVSVCVFMSNVLFWRQSGYFEPATDLRPLLHTWSLAVEEQFYIVYPVLLLALWRVAKGRVAAALTVAAAISLALCVVASQYQPTANFYLLPTRAWELFVGALCALRPVRPHRRQDDLLAWAGLAAILVAVATFDETTPFPSLWTLLPVVGTCFLLIYAVPTSGPGRVLSTPSLVGLGIVSYGAYLWHQPLFAFARLRTTRRSCWA